MSSRKEDVSPSDAESRARSEESGKAPGPGDDVTGDTIWASEPETLRADTDSTLTNVPMASGPPEASPRRSPVSIHGFTPGQRVAGRYQIESAKGYGGMGVVFRARDVELQRTVALKVLLADPHASRKAVSMFKREAKVIAALDHPSIVKIFDTGRHAGRDFIVMEWVDGPDLGEWRKQHGSPDRAEILNLFSQICDALSHVHRKGIVHRDLKPANILVSSDGRAKVGDFGLAHVPAARSISRTGDMLGTPAYAAPEQYVDAKHVDQRADVFSLAKTLYFALTGEVPDPIEASLLPPEVAHVIGRATRLKPDERYASVDAFWEDLKGALLDSEARGVEVARAEPGIVCPGCGTMNPGGARFCKACGTPLTRECPWCRREIPVDASFCTLCGANLERAQQYRQSLEAAESYLEGWRLREAKGALTQALESMGSGAEAMELLGRLRQRARELAALRRQIGRLRRRKQFDRALDLVAQLGARQPGEATERLRTLIETEAREEQRRKRVVLLRSQLEAARRRGRVNEAVRLARSLQKLDPEGGWERVIEELGGAAGDPS